MPVAGGDDEVRIKLGVSKERFDGFGMLLDKDSKARKDADDSMANVLKETVVRLEKTLNAEIKRRVESNKALQGMFEAQMATMQDKLEAGLLGRLDQLHGALGSLNDRVDCVEKDFSLTREQYVRDIEDRSAMVTKDAAALQSAFLNERAERKERETLIIAKLRDLELRTVERLASDEADAEEKYKELHDDLKVAVPKEEDMDDGGDKPFQDYILEEMAGLKNGLVVETQTREQADDDIVSALNHYTKAIQDALRVVNQA
ncbi:unnamed protein product [Polarella glacialis]|uniref:SF-assemblin n=1 Tax=Polarella glacialis TaxID=89957 RepID=A0A813H9Y7_POLGL|nr:unnamed protein product [Polarella glacialis]CAE8642166.1 unnamed protein product [Polarella glacialis]CAE8735882.1 unnamed protein product [Polarella glacialis]|mmetsp:Transcript_45804/g.74443  ORF Transcript_45804/g.74443 Transcript_45804/m.74443 type:complete len:260 (-) Transcript_45804:72-851(-)